MTEKNAPEAGSELSGGLDRMIEKGSKIRISDNLRQKLEELKFSKEDARRIAARFAGTEQTAHDIWTDSDGQTYVTLDLCCEVPIECCEAA